MSVQYTHQQNMVLILTRQTLAFANRAWGGGGWSEIVRILLTLLMNSPQLNTPSAKSMNP